MSTNHNFTLNKHRLSHISQLTVSKDFFRQSFEGGCSMMNCNGKCCKDGVWADLTERDKILAHKDLIKKYMEPTQDHDHTTWFDEQEVEDPDFPSGKAIGTQTRGNGCVFLNSNGHCVLQRAATEEGMSKFFLKPFYCFAFPIALEFGELVLDDPDFTYQTQCCSTVENGNLTAMDVCAEELEFMLGNDGFTELQSIAETVKQERK
ncbi:MAG: DUF3109 family protein [Ignavibacteriae bacterium]|nr:DUF3109 family protein [Ignavibacteriota bacterium]